MSEQRKDEAPSDVLPVEGRKKPYEKPKFQYERVFERLALSCGKIDTTEEQCGTQACSS